MFFAEWAKQIITKAFLLFLQIDNHYIGHIDLIIIPDQPLHYTHTFIECV